MDFVRKEILDDCQLWLSILCNKIDLGNGLNLTDASLHAEAFFRNILNEVFGWQLESLNALAPNSDAIDLGSDITRIAVQVTSTTTPAKIRQTLEGFSKNKLQEEYDRLIFVYPKLKRPRFKADFSADVPNGYVFDVAKDTLSFKEILAFVSQFELERQHRFKEILREELRPIVTALQDVTEDNRQGAVPTNLPQLGMPDLVGRRETLHALHSLLSDPTRGVAIQCVTGMAGAGKTELLKHYAWAHLEEYSGGVIWINARSEDIVSQILEFAHVYFDICPPDSLLSSSARVAYCWSHWPLESPVLIILDDVVESHLIENYLPSASRFRTLVTSRVSIDSRPSLELKVLAPSDAAQLLKNIIGSERFEDEAGIATNLCNKLGNLPLGIELIGRYLGCRKDLRLKTLYSRIDTEGLGHAAFSSIEPGMTAFVGAEMAFELGWVDLSKDARYLGCLLSLFGLAPIPWELVEGCFDKPDRDRYAELRDSELLRMNFLKREQRGIYEIHPLLHDFLRNKIGERSDGEKMIQQFCESLLKVAKSFPRFPRREEISTFAPLVPHLEEVALARIQSIESIDTIWPFEAIARYYDGRGLFDVAEVWLQRSVATCTEKLSGNHPLVGAALNNLAENYQSQGRYSEAEPLLKEALEITEGIMGTEDHPWLANLARLYTRQGRYTEANSLLERAMSRDIEVDGNSPFGAVLNNLAVVYQIQSRDAEAEQLFVQSLERTKKTMGEDHPLVGTIMCNLGRLYCHQLRFEESREQLESAIDLCKSVLGRDHPETGFAFSCMANLYRAQGDFAGAERMLQIALTIAEGKLGKEHPRFGVWLSDLGLLYSEVGRYAESEPLIRQSLTVLESSLGVHHLTVGHVLANLGELLRNIGRLDEAERIFLRAIRIVEESLGSDHLSLADTLNNLALVMNSLQRYGEAKPMFQRALRISRQNLETGHPEIGVRVANLAFVSSRLGEHKTAKRLLTQSLLIAKDAVESEHPAAMTLLDYFAIWLDLAGMRHEASKVRNGEVNLGHQSKLLGSIFGLR